MAAIAGAIVSNSVAAQADVATADATSASTPTVERLGERWRVRFGGATHVPDVAATAGDTATVVRVDGDANVFALRIERADGQHFHVLRMDRGRLRPAARFGPVRATGLTLRPLEVGGAIVLEARGGTCAPLLVRAPALDAASEREATAVDVTMEPTGVLAVDATLVSPELSLVRLRDALAPLRAASLTVELAPGRDDGRDFLVLAGASSTRVRVPEGATRVSLPWTFGAPACAILATTNAPGFAREIVASGLVGAATTDELAGQLVAELAAEGPRAEAASLSLVALGAPGLAALEAAFADALPDERRRQLRVAELLVPRHPNALRLFVLAIESGDEPLRDHAVARLLALGALGHPALEVALRRGNHAVALPFAERKPAAAAQTLLALLAEADDEGRRAMHAALTVSLRRAPEARRSALAFLSTSAATESRAVVLDALRETLPPEELASAFAAMCGAPEAVVEVQLRCLEALAAVPRLARRDADVAWAESSLRSETWMVRRAALDALADVDSASALTAKRGALTDESPRVRARAVALLADDGASLETIARLSRQDDWPMVRLAANTVLLDHDGAERVLRLSLTDRSIEVRVGLYDALRERHDLRFVTEATQAVARHRAPTEVIVAAVRYLDAACATTAREALVAAVQRAVESQGERQRAIGFAAARALERFGGEENLRVARSLLGPAPARAGAVSRCTP